MQGRIDALWFLLAARQQKARDPLINVGLLIPIHAPGNASPEGPPIELALHLIAVGEAGGVDAAGLLDAEVVARVAEPWAQTESGQIEPAHFVRGALLTAIGRGEEGIRHLAD